MAKTPRALIRRRNLRISARTAAQIESAVTTALEQRGDQAGFAPTSGQSMVERAYDRHWLSHDWQPIVGFTAESNERRTA